MKTTRSIHEFELNLSYYKETWINGNKTHVKEELSELFLVNKSVALNIILELPKEISLAVVNSQQFMKASI